MRRRASTLSRLADEDLMELVQAGDSKAFAMVYDRHASVSFSLAYRMCGARPQAEEVVQEAFLSIWRAGGRYDRNRGSVRTWVLGIVHHRAIDALRRGSVHDRRRAGDEGLEEHPAPGERLDTQVARREEAERVRAAMEGLPAEQRRVVELAYFGGFSHTEIAEMLGAPVGTVKGRMRLALGKLKAILEPQGVTP